MPKRYALAPVILIMVAAIMGTETGYAAQAQSGKTEAIARSGASKDPGSSFIGREHEPGSPKRKIAQAKKSRTAHVMAAKKGRLVKFLGASTTRKDVGQSRHAHADLERVLPEELSSYKPYDLWLAYELPETYNELTTQARLKRLRLGIVESAYRYVGTPYMWGGTTPEGFDCSGFVRYVYEENGIRLSRTSGQQAREGSTVPLSELRPGDLIFFDMNRRNRRPVDHVGMYLGDGHFIHAPSRKSRMIKIEDLENTYYLPKIVEARRVVDPLRREQ